MTNEPEKPAQPHGAVEYPPVDYPADAGLPPLIYPPPPPGYPGGPAYYPMYDPYQPMKPPGTNGKAIASLVTSLASLPLCCGLPPVSSVGLVLGFLAMREIKRTGQDGHGLALAGVIVGALATAGWVIYGLFWVALMASGWQWI